MSFYVLNNSLQVYTILTFKRFKNIKFKSYCNKKEELYCKYVVLYNNNNMLFDLYSRYRITVHLIFSCVFTGCHLHDLPPNSLKPFRF